MQISLDSNDILEKRAHERYPVSMRVWAAVDERGGWLQVADVSLDGVGCVSERRYAPMSRVLLSFDVTCGRGERDAKSLEVEAIVCRCTHQDGTWRVGLRLAHPNSLSRDRFVRFLRSKLLDNQPALDRNHS